MATIRIYPDRELICTVDEKKMRVFKTSVGVGSLREYAAVRDEEVRIYTGR